MYDTRPPHARGSQVHGAACTPARGHQPHCPPSLLAIPNFLTPRLRMLLPRWAQFPLLSSKCQLFLLFRAELLEL